MSDLMLDVDQAGELKAAFRRDPRWTNALIKKLCERGRVGERDLLSQVCDVVCGLAAVTPLITPHKVQAGGFLIDKRGEGWKLVRDVGREPVLSAGSHLAPSSVPIDRTAKLQQLVESVHAAGEANLGQRQGELLWESKDLLVPFKDKHLLIFPGTIWENREGRRYVFCLAKPWRVNNWQPTFRSLHRRLSRSDSGEIILTLST